jgi:hypothetical protein
MEPSRGALRSRRRSQACIVFCEPDPNYIRLSLCEKASHNKGGRSSKKKEVRARGTPPEKHMQTARARHKVVINDDSQTSQAPAGCHIRDVFYYRSPLHTLK